MNVAANRTTTPAPSGMYAPNPQPFLRSEVRAAQWRLDPHKTALANLNPLYATVAGYYNAFKSSPSKQAFLRQLFREMDQDVGFCLWIHQQLAQPQTKAPCERLAHANDATLAGLITLCQVRETLLSGETQADPTLTLIARMENCLDWTLFHAQLHLSRIRAHPQ